MAENLLNDPCCLVGLLGVGILGIGWVTVTAAKRVGCALRRRTDVSQPPRAAAPVVDRHRNSEAEERR